MTTPLARLLGFARAVINDFLDDDAMSLAAAIAFYTALSFAPLVLLIVAVGGIFGHQTQNDLIRAFEQQLGPNAGDVTQEVIRSADRSSETSADRSLFATALLLLTASGVFGQLQASLNRVWDVAAKPVHGWRGAWRWVRRRLLSIGMVLTIMFVLLASLVVSTTIQWLIPRLGVGEAFLSRIAIFFASFATTTAVFAAMFKFLPEVELRWRQVWTGAAITSLLFTLGKAVLALYLVRARVGQDYGSAASGLIALLVWVYYSSIVLLLGAEITQQSVRRRGLPPRIRETGQTAAAAATPAPAAHHDPSCQRDRR